MDPTSIIGILIEIIKEAPEAIAAVESAYALYQSNTITADQMVALWQAAASSVQAAEKKWKAAIPPA